MKMSFTGAELTGIVLVVPSNERSFEDDMASFEFAASRSLKLKAVMGYDKHRIVNAGVSASDLICQGLTHMFEIGSVTREEIDALVVVSQSPDYLIPPTSNVVQGRLGLSSEVLCLDINQGCAGFVIGLIESLMLLQQESVRKVVLANVDILSRKVSVRDRNSYPLIGDAASITVFESAGSQNVCGIVRMDGKRHEALMIPAGGFRNPITPETSVERDIGDGNFRSDENLVMDGSAVFNFVQVEVPPMIEDILDMAKLTKSDIDYFAFHQPNRFMLEKLADKMGVERWKMPNDVVQRFGNSSGVTIPSVLSTNLGIQLLNERLQLCFAGFGVGLTWAAVTMQVGPLKFCEMIEI